MAGRLPAPEGLLLGICEGADWPAAPEGRLGTEPTVSAAESFLSHHSCWKGCGSDWTAGHVRALCRCWEGASRSEEGSPGT